MPNKSKGKKEEEVFWARVSCETDELMWSGVSAINSKYGSGASFPHIFTNRKEAEAQAGCDLVIPCFIRFNTNK